MRQLDVWLNRDRVGTLSEGNDLWEFEYDATWAGRPDGFSLAPGLPRETLKHVDGGSNRPVQWYFDNLLPEEKLRETLLKTAGIKGGDDAFALLEYLGAESAGSLSLLPPGADPAGMGGRKALESKELSRRIQNLSREPLSTGAPKRMSLAGAQNKLPVIRLADGSLFEPVGNEPSTHILKPNHTSDDYAASVINEFFIMRLAGRVKLPVPPVYVHYVPEPVYVIERFDRVIEPEGRTRRRHIIDACQLLNKSRTYKTTATMDTLLEVIGACRVPAQTRVTLFRWLAFCALIGNDDNHLKNLSFHVEPESEGGIFLAPHYDLLSTSVYATKAMADHRAIWDNVPMTIPHPSAKTFANVTRETLLEAGRALGVPEQLGNRHLNNMVEDIRRQVPLLVADIARQHEKNPQMKAEDREIEMRVLRAIQHIVIHDMLAKVA